MSDHHPHINLHMASTHPEAFQIGMQSDGTSTFAEITRQGSFGPTMLGFGVARRRKGDKRNEDIAMKLALGRAFKNAADQIEKDLNRRGYTL